jgi:transposase-like protein
MKTNNKTPKTLQEAIVYFSDPERAFVYAVNLRWPDGVIACPRCGNDKHSFVKTRLLWFCKGCKKQFTVKVGTIFEDSALGLDKWMTAVWMIVNCKNGISSHELGRALGITQKSAWFMLHRIREALKNESIGGMGGPGGIVEADETFVGGKAQFMHGERRKKLKGIWKSDKQWRSEQSHFAKTPVMGLIDRGTRQVRCKVIPTVKRHVLQSEILKHVTKGSTICTDDLGSYRCLPLDKFEHQVVDHAREYVRGQVHTNGIENFWSLLKRGLKGTYVAVEPFHLDRYVDEQVFRFNNRKDGERKVSDSERFALAMSLVAGKRLTYSELTGKDTDTLHS